MKFNDLIQLLEQDESIFQPRKMEDRKTRYIQQIYRKIQDYIKNGSEGDLNLSRIPIQTLPDGLKVGGNLYLSHTPIAKQYNYQQLKQMYPGVKGDIYV